MGNIEKHPAVYIIANRYRGTIYIGVTSDLWTRIANHKNKSMPGFTSKYGLAKLVWYEHRITMEIAIRREQLYRSFSENGNPTLKSTLAVMKALGIELSAKAG
jgi:putative endonuclease